MLATLMMEGAACMHVACLKLSLCFTSIITVIIAAVDVNLVMFISVFALDITPYRLDGPHYNDGRGGPSVQKEFGRKKYSGRLGKVNFGRQVCNNSMLHALPALLAGAPSFPSACRCSICLVQE